ncbi:uncharacterized protein LOC142324992 isoform X2 [Lycorma delicatula]|uniref:uncharacterized protein LOC142324992 isoform X2 n=1 Tax=Lycorma delicatula TaxID=130591 RepID=UPI003F517492
MLGVLFQDVQVTATPVTINESPFAVNKNDNYELINPERFKNRITNKRQIFSNNFGGNNNNNDFDDLFVWGSNRKPSRQTPSRRITTEFTTTSSSVTTPTTTSSSPTPPSRPIENECTRRCFTTPAFNPVCGTDKITYVNPTRLNCAKDCGQRVEISHYGNCIPTGPRLPFPRRDK